MAKRPDLFVPLSVRFATGVTGTRIQERFGIEGLGVWAALLAAAKVSRPPGEISYASEAEFWATLGLIAPPKGFALDEFLSFLGRLKVTRQSDKRRAGRVQHVRVTSWGRWNDVRKREAERLRKSSKRAESQADTKRTGSGRASGHDPDLDLEVEKEKLRGRSKRSATRANGLPSAKQHHLEKLLTAAGSDVDAGTRQVFAGFVADLPEASVARALESLAQANGVRDRARYLSGALRSEWEEHGIRKLVRSTRSKGDEEAQAIADAWVDANVEKPERQAELKDAFADLRGGAS